MSDQKLLYAKKRWQFRVKIDNSSSSLIIEEDLSVLSQNTLAVRGLETYSHKDDASNFQIDFMDDVEGWVDLALSRLVLGRFDVSVYLIDADDAILEETKYGECFITSIVRSDLDYAYTGHAETMYHRVTINPNTISVSYPKRGK